MIHLGACQNVLKSVDSDSIDSLITDPPAGISFMNKEWDKPTDFIQNMTETYKECLRVLKPGAHGLVWAIPRTSHWTATALEHAGFEIRDVITHIFGSGFPKSLDVSKAIEKSNGVQLKEVEISRNGGGFNSTAFRTSDIVSGKTLKHIPTTPEAKQWEGFGTALKPASEHWILVRKPLSEPTVAKNVLKHGTGGLNIDASRIAGHNPSIDRRNTAIKTGNHPGRPGEYGHCIENRISFEAYSQGKESEKLGRFPANLVLSHNEDCDEVCTEDCAIAMLDEQSGFSKGGTRGPHINIKIRGNGVGNNNIIGNTTAPADYSDSGGASRFFYCAKASRKDRNEGLEGMEEKYNDFQRESSGLSQGKDPITGERSGVRLKPQANHHPTVKSTKLMEYLIKLITPPTGIVLDPFMGSGSTGVAAKKLGFEFVGIEKEKEYFEIAKARIG